MVVALLMLGMKINQIVEGKQKLDELLVRPAIAQTEVSGRAEASAPVSMREQSEGEAEEEGATAVMETQSTQEQQPKEYNQIELDILQSLAQRREEIESWSEELEVREKVLQATEMRIDNKISQMQNLKQEVQSLLTTYDKKQKQELQSLVKIYESMKPKDAARIFNELEMDILLDVVEMMSERKAAPVIAEMDSQRAKALTEELADRRRLQMMSAEMTQDAEG